jgi:hypothetical protein
MFQAMSLLRSWVFYSLRNYKDVAPLGLDSKLLVRSQRALCVRNSLAKRGRIRYRDNKFTNPWI